MTAARAALILLGISLLARPVVAQETPPPRLYRNPTMNADRIAFALGDEIWTVSRNGGVAVRLSIPGRVRAGPLFSPDGRMIAYSAAVGPNTDVYVADVRTGHSRRVTWHPGIELATTWTPDGKDVVFTMPGSGTRNTMLFRAAMSGDDTPTPLPLPQGQDASYSPDGTRLAYVPTAIRSAGYRIPWKQYRAGGMPHVSIVNLETLDVTNITGIRSNDLNPMWVGSRVYFLSDRDGLVTLYSYDIASGSIRRLVENTTFDLKSASAGPGGIIYEQFGGVHIYDFASGRTHQVPIEIPESQLAQRRPREIVVPASQVAEQALSPDGSRIAVSARGEVFVLGTDSTVAPRNLTNTTTLLERDPSWAPDGRRVSYFEDSLGHSHLVIRNADGSGTVQRIALARRSGSSYGNAHWSPDGARILYSDGDALWLVASDGGTSERVGGGAVSAAPWSPDSKWITLIEANRVRLYSAERKTRMDVTDGTSQVFNAVFDPRGQYVYFLGSLNRNAQRLTSGMSYNHASTVGVFAVPLKRGAGLPSATTPVEAQATNPDSAGLTHRVALLSIPMANYTSLAVDAAGRLYLSEGPPSVRATPYTSLQGGDTRGLRRFGWGEEEPLELLTGAIASPQFSRDGSTLLYQEGGTWRTLATSLFGNRTLVQPSSGRLLSLRGLRMMTDPPAEWTIMYHDAWRIEREFFYDTTFHGLDIDKAERMYGQFLPGLTNRGDLVYLMREMLTNLSVGHISVSAPADPEESDEASGVRVASTGLLGVDVQSDAAGYKISRIYRGDPWVPGQRGPLAAPGVDIREGEYLLAVNGRPLRAGENFFRAFAGTAGRGTELTVGNGSGNSRTVTVTPSASDDPQRSYQWIQDNYQKVDSLSKGRVAYIYMPNTGGAGWDSFLRYYLLQGNRAGIVIDERFNGGGDMAESPLMFLQRTPLTGPSFSIGRDRPGDEFLTFNGRGPRAMIINELAGSGGDIMPFMFREAKLGPLVGTRTYGIAIGNAYSGLLLDGGRVAAPRGVVSGFGEWGMEGVGVAPDIEVRMDPKAVAQGHDPQLETAVAEVLGMLKRQPVVRYPRPALPRPIRGNGLEKDSVIQKSKPAPQ